MNMLFNKCSYTNKIGIKSPMQINEIHKLDDYLLVHSSKAKLDKIRGSGRPYPLHLTSLWLLYLTSPHSSQYNIAPCWYMRYLCMKRHWGLQQSGNQYWKIHYTYLQKSSQSLPPSARKIVHWIDSIFLIYKCYWQHSTENELSPTLECINHNLLAPKMY